MLQKRRNQKNSYRQLSVLLFTVVSSLLVVVPVDAVTNVTAVVCSGDSKPTLSIEAPVGDSTHPVGKLQIAGAVMNSNQIIVSIDGKYDKTSALRANQTQYKVGVMLSAGTHTITMTAQGICANQVTTTNVVVTASPILNDSPTPPITSIDDSGSEVISSPSPLVHQTSSITAPTTTPYGDSFHWFDIKSGESLPEAVSDSVQLMWVATFTTASITLLFAHQIAQYGFFKTRKIMNIQIAVVSSVAMLLSVALAGAS